ncbi:3-hydroxyisobutyrate dehydrogenase [Deinococcus sp. HSC-46F16]|uniref:NAD(P)-dependent oxidoreductase n=1 Tax=Deinococcus sp. HSC-46F16 TaxID=2910968 RepID=UPI00209D0EEC|nr:NAD(P)-dependent oxidoreductase [Deinococcus sp. HSC-46F16]MCP2013384.1 3-hydroxyisobutyrate dehydrogenase [Deinococcus sp. HSC-46F16]
MSRTTAFLGLGAMGAPMAAHLARQARDTGGRALVWNRTGAKADAHAREHGSEAAHLSGAARADVIFSCLPTSREVDEVLAELEADLRPGTVWVDCTSGHPEAARRQSAWLAERAVAFLDAPVSGGTAGAQAGTLTVMVGGEADVLDRVRPDLAFAGKVVHVGGTGAGFAVKAVNNALLAVNLWAAGEGLAALARAGVDVEGALEVINASSGRSNASENLIGQRVLTREFPVTFGLGLLAKDAGIAADVVRAAGASAPVLMQTEALFRAAATVVGAGEDHTAALRLIEQMNDQEIR